MIGVLICSGILLFVLCFIAFTPLVIEIDSVQDICELRLTGIAKAKLYFDKNTIQLILQVLWWKKTIDPFKPTGSAKTKKKKRSAPKKREFNFYAVKKKSKKVMNSFKIKYFYLNVDTGDYLVNAWLYPLSYLINNNKRTLQINYNGDLILRLKIVNNIGRILIAVIK